MMRLSICLVRHTDLSSLMMWVRRGTLDVVIDHGSCDVMVLVEVVVARMLKSCADGRIVIALAEVAS